MAEGDPQVQKSVRLYEPPEAVYSGPTGLEVYGELLGAAPSLMSADACLVVEIGFGQHPALLRLAADTGWRELLVEKDLAGIERCVVLTPMV